MSALTILIARLARPRAARRALNVRPGQRVIARLTAEEQLNRLATMISGSVERVRFSGSCHAAAEIQLDAAAYALRELVQDLSTVMTLPERRSASLMQLPPHPVRVVARRRVAFAA